MIDVIGHEDPPLKQSIEPGNSLWFVLAIIVQLVILTWLFVCKPDPLTHRNVNSHRIPRSISSVFDL